MDDHDDGHAELGDFLEVIGDGLRLAALFGADAGISAGRVNEGEDGAAEFLRQLHEAQGLSITFRLRHAEVAQEFLLGVAPFLVADDHHGLALKPCQSAHQCWIIAKAPIAMELGEIGEEILNVVERVGPLRVAGQEDALPRVVGARGHMPAQRFELDLQPLDLFARGVRLGDSFELLDLALEVLDDSELTCTIRHGTFPPLSGLNIIIRMFLRATSTRWGPVHRRRKPRLRRRGRLRPPKARDRRLLRAVAADAGGR